MIFRSLPRSTLIIYGLFTVATAIDQYRLLKAHRLLQTAYELSIRDRHTVAYLLDMLKKNDVPFDGFDAIALMYHYPEYLEKINAEEDE